MEEEGTETPVMDREAEGGGVELEIVTEELETPAAAEGFAVWTGMRLELPSGRRLAFLMCTADPEGAGLLVEGVQGPSDDDQDMIECSCCGRRHYVVSLATALEEELFDVDDALLSVAVTTLLALTLRDLEEIAARRRGRTSRGRR